jgi:hypothetical protein
MRASLAIRAVMCQLRSRNCSARVVADGAAVTVAAGAAFDDAERVVAPHSTQFRCRQDW